MATLQANLPRDRHHLYLIDDVKMRIDHVAEDRIIFAHEDDPLKTPSFTNGVINRKRALGEIKVIPFGLLPKDRRPYEFEEPVVSMAGLPPEKEAKVAGRYALVRSFLQLKELGAVKGTDASIKANMEVIHRNAKDYLFKDLPNPAYAAQFDAWRSDGGTKPKTPDKMPAPPEVSARTLRTWVKAYERGGKRALVDNSHKQGNCNSSFSLEEVSLMVEVVKNEYLHRQRKTIKAVVEDVQIAFAQRNKMRAAEGLRCLKTPGRDAVRRTIKGFSRFRTLAARYGEAVALAKMRMSKPNLPNIRPLQEVEMDEWEVDLLTMLNRSGLLGLFDEDSLQMLHADAKHSRWWLVAAICRRTRVILGMTLTLSPRASSAIKCLEMATMDKSSLTNASGALSNWSVFGIPETIFVDNGVAFKSGAFTTAVADLGTSKIQTIGGISSMRPYIESFFYTISIAIMQRLLGRTFSNPQDRGDYPSEKLAVHSLDDLAFALVRWVVDAYHNEPHEGLGGRTPMQQWEADLAEGNFPIHAAPDERTRFLCFGIPMERKVQKDGITVLNLQYGTRELAKWFLHNGNKALKVRWHPSDVGKIYAFIDGDWHALPATFQGVHGVDATTWRKARKALRDRDPQRRAWEEETVRRMIIDIEDLRKQRELTYGLVDHGWDSKSLNALEEQACVNFQIVSDRQRSVPSSDGFGEKILPEPQAQPTAAKAAAEAAPKVTAAVEAQQKPAKRQILISKRAE